MTIRKASRLTAELEGFSRRAPGRAFTVDSNRRISDPEARRFGSGLVDVGLRFIPLEPHEEFFVDFEVQLGFGLGI